MTLDTRKEYSSRINRVADYIENNLTEALDLDTLAKVACFSPFHFHRIFKSWMGETLNQYINRIRVERAATQLLSVGERSITDVAFQCGFSSSAAFARSFKAFYGMSATQWVETGGREFISKNGQSNRKSWKASDVEIHYYWGTDNSQQWRFKMNDKEIEVKVCNYDEVPVAYVRNVGPYKGDVKLFESMFQRLCGWAGPRGLLHEESRFFSIYHDNPEVTEEQKLRMSICVSAPGDTEVTGGIGKMVVAGGLYAVAHFEITDPSEYENAWKILYGSWLPESGYQPDDRLPFEEYLNDPKTDPEGRHIFNICIPIKPL